MAGRPLICAAASVTLLLSPTLATAAGADDTGDPSARELAREAEDHLLHTQSLHMTWTDRTAATKKGELQSMDLSLDRDGNCVGTMRMGAHGGSLAIIKQGDEVWLKGDSTYWKAELPGTQGNAAAELLKDRYIHGTTHDSMLKGWADACDLKAFQKELTPDSSPEKPLTRGDRTTVDGIPVIPLKGEEDGKPVTLYVTADSPHVLVQGTQKGDGTDLTMKFSDYGEPVPSATPSAKESVDVSQLEDLRST
ncbi:hypothetical protein ACFWIO_07335 [Streptomyces diastatochromogenes]|uniref:hypothetical protein n=1 Tax=Streptomyces diastatochromogenes TaxID=42236 RepID=UPI003646DD61